MKLRVMLGACIALALSSTANADVAAGVRAGTTGAGLELTFGLTEKLNLRLGYAAYTHDDEIEDSDVLYDGELKLKNTTGLLDWHAFGGGFHLTAGAVGVGTEVDVTGRPSGGFYEIGDETFSAAEVGSVRGTIEYENSVSPYVGFGWGNAVDDKGRVTLLLDIGAIYTGSPTVNLTAQCGSAIPVSRCAELQQAIDDEEAELEDEGAVAEWWPVINVGFAVRF